MLPTRGKVRIFIVATHLGVINRGFESSTQTIFDNLRDSPELDLWLMRGANPGGQKNEHVAWSLKSGTWSNKALSFIFGRPSTLISQDTFFFGLLPWIIFSKPEMIVVQERHLANRLYHLKKFLKLNFKIYFINGGPFLPPFVPPKGRCDHVQHLTDFHYQQSIDAGDAKEKISLIPYGEKISEEFKEMTREEKLALRKKLALPSLAMEKPMLLSCAALNRAHKRIDYLIDEVAALPKEIRPFLVMIGAIEADTPGLMQMAKEKLGDGNFVMRQVPQSETTDYYRAADLFVLSSLNEGLPRVLIEATNHGLACHVHDYPVTRFVLGGYGIYGQFTMKDSLAEILNSSLNDLSCIMGDAPDRHAWAYKYYSWDKLKPQYVENFLKVARGQ